MTEANPLDPEPTIIVDLVKTAGTRRTPNTRPQPWRYLTKDAGNHKTLEKSSENLTNRDDAIAAIEDVHGPNATVALYENGQPVRILRRAYPHPGMADTTIIGPECFIANDGSALMYRGECYTAQGAPAAQPATASRHVELTESERAAVIVAIWGPDATDPRLGQTVDRILTAINGVTAAIDEAVEP